MSKWYLDAIDNASGIQCRRMDGEGGGFNPPGTEERKGNMQIKMKNGHKNVSEITFAQLSEQQVFPSKTSSKFDFYR